MAKEEQEHWTVQMVERAGERVMLEPEYDIRIVPGTGGDCQVSVSIPRLTNVELKGCCVCRGAIHWVQAQGRDGGNIHYVFHAFIRGESSPHLLEGFITRIEGAVGPPTGEPQDTETWTAMKPPREDESGRE